MASGVVCIPGLIPVNFGGPNEIARYNDGVKRVLSAAIFFLLIGIVFAQTSPLRVGKGDVLKVWIFGQEGLTGSYAVLSDGSVTIPRIGRILAEGKSLNEIESALKGRAKSFLVDPEISVVFESESPKFVFLVSEFSESGSTPYVSGMDLRQLMSQAKLPADPGVFSATLYRDGKKIADVNLREVLEQESAKNVELRPNDLVTLLPAKSMRVWLSGAVRSPGEYLILPGTTVEQSLAAAGGIDQLVLTRDEVNIELRRGESFKVFSYADSNAGLDIPLEEGDIVTVKTVLKLNVSVGGKVRSGGAFTLRMGTTALELIANAGGVLPDGTLRNVYVIRGSEIKVLNLANNDSLRNANAVLQSGDFVYVPANVDAYHVFGEVREPGKKLIEDGVAPHLAEAISASRGLSAEGVFRDVVVARADKNGEMVITSYNLDDYFKSGKVDQNPLIMPGDIIYVRPKKTLAISEITRIISTSFYLNRIFD